MATAIPTNECEFTLGLIAEVCGGSLHGAEPTQVVRGVSTDTRTITKGSLFVALRGERVDGHAFVAAALERGASAALVARDSAVQGPCVRVEDTITALGLLARTALRRERTSRVLPVLAIGGAAGKTTTKELAALSVAALFGDTLSTRGNLNNLVGAPMTLLTVAPAHRALVIEVGTNAPGEIAKLAAIVEPDVALVLNVDNEHTEGLKSLEAVAEEEGALFAGTRDLGTSTVVGNLEEPYSYSQIERGPKRARRLSFGEGEGADVRLLSRVATADGRSALRLRVSGALTSSGRAVECSVTLGLLGPGPAIDAAAALAATLALRARPVDADEIERAAKAFAQAAPVAGRLVPVTLSSGAMVIDDTYNANPRSVKASIDAAAELAALRGGSLHVLIGDMLELGELAPSLHGEVRDYLSARMPKSVAAVGPLFSGAFAKIASDDVRCVRAPEDAAEWAHPRIDARDVVLVKGSRGIRMERAVAALCANTTTMMC